MKPHLKDHEANDLCSECQVCQKELFQVGEAQLTGCLKVWVSGRWIGTQASSDKAQGVIQDTVHEVSARCDTRLACSTLLASSCNPRFAPAPHPKPPSRSVTCKVVFCIMPQDAVEHG